MGLNSTVEVVEHSFEVPFLLSLIFIVILMALVVVLVQRLRHSRELQQREIDLRTTMTQELGHRIRNLITLIQSMSYQQHLMSMRRPNLHEKAREALALAWDEWERKLVALGASESILKPGSGGRGNIRDLVDMIGKTFGPRVEGFGPPVELKADCLVGINLVLHELATNATKYGALSSQSDTGKVTVSWEVSDDNCLLLDWVERGGPPVVRPQRTGFGTNLITKLALAQVRGTARIDYDPLGLTSHLELPL